MDLIEQLPSKFSKTLGLSHKGIATIGLLPKGSPFLQVEHLHLSYNKLANLENIEQFTKLKSLSLSNNQLSDLSDLKKVNSLLQYLTLSGNPLNVYDYHDVCYDIFPKLKRLDGCVVDRTLVAKQREIAEQVSRWLIPFLFQLEEYTSQIQRAVQLRTMSDEISLSRRQLVANDIVLQIDWPRVEQLIKFKENPNLVNLAKIVEVSIPSELDPETSRRLKQVHYNAFKDLIKILADRKFTSLIDFLIMGGDDYYRAFIGMQRPQTHVGQDLYVMKENLSEEQPKMVVQEVPDFLRDKLKNKSVIQNTYTKPRQRPQFEKQEFYQYFPVYPFRTEYVHAIVDLVAQRMQELKNLLQQIAALQSTQTPIATQRTMRRKPQLDKVTSKEPTPNTKIPQPTKRDEAEIVEHDIKLQEADPSNHYKELKVKLLKEKFAQLLGNILKKVFERRLMRTMERLNDRQLPDSYLLDFPELERLRHLFLALKRAATLQKQRRKFMRSKTLLMKCFYKWKGLKRINKRTHKRILEGLRKLKEVYLLQKVFALKQIKEQGSKATPAPKPDPPFSLTLKDAPRKHTLDSQATIHRPVNRSQLKRFKICSVCDY